MLQRRACGTNLICISNTLKAWSMKEMSWKRWMESPWSTRSQRKSFLFWLVSPLLFAHIVWFNVSVPFSCPQLFLSSFQCFNLGLRTRWTLFDIFLYCQQISWKEQNQPKFVRLSILLKFLTMSVALRSNPICSCWRCKTLKMSHYIYSFFSEKISVLS